MANKKITIDNLAIMMKKGFDDTATKIQVSGLEKRVDGLEGRFDGVEKRLDKIDARLERIEGTILKHHASQIESLEKRILRLEETSSIE